MARPLTKTYTPLKPYVVSRQDLDDGRIAYEIWDERPATYHRLCTIYENDDGDRSEAKRDAELIVRALNTAVSGEVSDRLKGERKV